MWSNRWCTLGGIAITLVLTEVPAFACSCSRVRSFSEAIQRAPVVVVGRLVSAADVPPPPPEPDPAVITVRPFMGAGMVLVIDSVAKGDVPEKQIRAWDFLYGDCGNPLRTKAAGTPVVIALSRVSDFSAETREGWGAAAAIPDSDYLASSGCTYATQVLSPAEHAEWIDRKNIAPLPSRRLESRTQRRPQSEVLESTRSQLDTATQE